MRSNEIWSVSFAYGDRYHTRDGLTKKQAKEVFGKLARDTSANINNDYLDLLTIDKDSKRGFETLLQMQRVGKGEYVYWHKGQYTESGYEAAQIVANL